MEQNCLNFLTSSTKEALFNRTSIVTATQRLSHEYINQFNALQQANNQIAWQSCDILPFNTWLIRFWKHIRFSCKSKKILLNDLQLHTLWKSIIIEDLGSNKLNFIGNIEIAVKSVVEAWTFINHWKIDITQCRDSFQIDHRNFFRWSEMFKEHCEKHQWIDSSTLIDSMLNMVSISDIDIDTMFDNLMRKRKLMLSGFYQMTPQQKNLIHWIKNSNVQLEILEMKKAIDDSPLPEFLEFENENQQWFEAASWAKMELEKKPNQRLGIIIPNIHHSVEKIRYAMLQVLCPNEILRPKIGHRYPFYIYIGQFIGQQPIINAAITLLSIADPSPFPYEIIGQLFLSPFISGATEELYERSRLEMWSRTHLPYRCNLSRLTGFLTEHISAPDCQILFNILISLNSLGEFDFTTSKQSFSSWIMFFKRWLDTAGWPGDQKLSREEEQIIEAFYNHLSRVESLDILLNKVDINTAIECLKKQMSESQLDPCALNLNTSIEIIDVLEASEIQFDAIWFGGLTEQSWPPPLNISPFIPQLIQKSTGRQQSSIELNTRFAHQLEQRLCNNCKRIIFSRYGYASEGQFSPSLFSKDAIQTTKPLSLAQKIQLIKPKMECILDDKGLSLKQTSVKGGSLLIKNQADCPFKAYATHRLGAKNYLVPTQGLNVAQYGVIIHSILAKLWRKLKTSKSLKTRSSNEIQDLVRQCVRQCSRKYQFISGCGNLFFQSVDKWLTHLVLEWINVEINRVKNFEVIEIEQNQFLKLDQLEIQLKIDRVDKLDDGSIALIDYKTGGHVPLNQWLGEKYKFPQLFLYAIATRHALSEPVKVVTYAFLRNGECGFHGICHQDEFQKRANNNKKTVHVIDQNRNTKDLTEQWDLLYSQWEYYLNGLAMDYASGEAQVAPIDSSVCKLCNLHGLCRIYESCD